MRGVAVKFRFSLAPLGRVLVPPPPSASSRTRRGGIRMAAQMNGRDTDGVA